MLRHGRIELAQLSNTHSACVRRVQTTTELLRQRPSLRQTGGQRPDTSGRRHSTCRFVHLLVSTRLRQSHGSAVLSACSRNGLDPNDRRCARIATTLAAVHPAHGVAIVEVVSGDGVLRSMSLMAILRQPSHGPTVEIPPETAHLPPVWTLKTNRCGAGINGSGNRYATAGRSLRNSGRFHQSPTYGIPITS